MNTRNADLVIQYALAVAGETDEYRQRELGPIHLLKYVYLGDLASAHAGSGSFTGASWRFYKFGPWAPEVLDRVAPAAKAIGAQERRFQSKYKEEDAVRWQTRQRGLAEQLERELPWHVARAVKGAVRKYGSDTPGLLEEVYRTPPMLNAAPGEFLRLDVGADPVPDEDTRSSGAPLPALSKTKVKRLQERVKQRLEQKRGKALAAPSPQPRYDDVFARGQQWLDDLAGEPIKSERGRVRFSDAVWKSPGRRDPEIP